MKNPRNIVGPAVRGLRQERGLTQAVMAAKLNLLGWAISRDTLAKIESYSRWVANSELLFLAEALGVEPGKLLKQSGSLKSLSEKSVAPPREGTRPTASPRIGLPL